jgi:hypothetical protein
VTLLETQRGELFRVALAGEVGFESAAIGIEPLFKESLEAGLQAFNFLGGNK